jgi:hypothetical protein
MQEITITDRFGHKRRARKGEVIAEGETVHFGPTSLLDAMASAMMTDTMGSSNPMVRDGYGAPAGHRPGYAFAANDARLRDVTAEAYEERCAHLADAWRHRAQPHEEAELVVRSTISNAPLRADTQGRTPDATQLTSDAEQAWQDKKQRLEQAWRRHRA